MLQNVNLTAKEVKQISQKEVSLVYQKTAAEYARFNKYKAIK